MLTANAARILLKDVQFPGDDDHTYLIAVSRKKRKAVLASGGAEARIAAALEVQRTWRAYNTRRKLKAILAAHCSKSTKTEDTKCLRCPAVTARYKEYLQRCRGEGLEEVVGGASPAVLSFEGFCATVIQTWWRRRQKLLLSQRMPQRSDVIVSVKSSRVLDEQSAAVVIQDAWRSYNDKKVFKFYCDLISFRRKGNPALMLRSINPKEAQLLDKAAGAHVRFRLGGTRFPPNIYYKVFTSRPVVDLCACSPRDYTAMAYHHRLPRDTHNKAPRSTTDDRENWYTRHENNGWRLVADRIFLGPLQDAVTIDTSAKKQEFHHSKLQRRQDVERRKKERKLQWLKKMYQRGSREELRGAATSAVLATVEGAEVDDLLTWSSALDYDKYITDWYLAASSASSDPNFKVVPSQEDSHELYIHHNK